MKAAKLLEEPAEEERLKAVVPFKEYPLADVDRAWEGEAAAQRLIRFAGGPDKDDMDFERFRSFFTIWDPQNPTNLSSYKLPHHDIIDGQPRTVFRGVVAAIAAVNGARGGVDASIEERRLAHGHLARHMREFDREPPPFAAREFMGAVEIEAMRDYHILMAEGFGLRVELKAADHLGEIERLRGAIEAISKKLDERDQFIRQAVSAEVGSAVRQLAQ